MKQSSTSVVVMSDAERRERLRNRIYAVFPVISVLLLILLWFLAAGAENSTFPSPVDIWNRFLLLMEKPIKQLNLFGHIWASLLRVFIALAFAWLLGISFGILIGWNKKANALLGPLFTAFRSVPPLAWVPLMTMWFGTGEFPKILIVFIGALMPVVVNTQAGISNVQNMYLNVGTIFHANKRQMLFEIAIPSALDAIFAGWWCWLRRCWAESPALVSSSPAVWTPETMPCVCCPWCVSVWSARCWPSLPSS